MIGVLPSAVLKYVIRPFVQSGMGWAVDLSAILTLFSSFIPMLIGLAIAMQFNMKSLDVGVMAIAVGVACGSINWASVPAGFKNPITGVTTTSPSTVYMASGAGDVINAMIVAAIGVLVIWLIAKYLWGFGSLAIILSPIVVGGGVGLIGKEIAPYVGEVTTWLGKMVQLATDLQPLPMTIIIAMAFAVIIVTPVSTVGIALAITLSGLGSAAAGVGIVATTVVLLINSFRVNKVGTTIAIFLGAMKGMMPSVFKKPIMLFSFMAAAALSALPISFLNVQGTPISAGFGWIGFVSPIQSVVRDAADKVFQSNVIGVMPAILVWAIVPIIAGIVVDLLFTKVFKLYKPEDFKQEI